MSRIRKDVDWGGKERQNWCAKEMAKKEEKDKNEKKERKQKKRKERKIDR